MGSYVIRMKVLPSDVSTDLEKMAQDVASALPPDSKVRSHRVEPIAFGLSAVMLDIVAPEEEGAIDRVEEAVSGVPSVSQSEVVGVSRMSSRLPPSSA
jgi:elongation factor 1-beta